MRGKAKKTISSGRDSKGELIVFEEGKTYDFSKYDKRKMESIKHLFEIKKDKEEVKK